MARADRIEVFCNEIMNGKSQRQAYHAAYPSSQKWKDEVVDSKASVFMKNGKVLERLEQLRTERAKENEITQNTLIEQLKSIGFAEISPELLKPADKIKALELIARMLGLDRPVDFGEVEDLTEIEGEVFD